MLKKRYTVVVEQTPNNWSAYVPDVWGCITTGQTREQVERNIVEALTGHFAVMHESGEPIPAPGTWTSVVEVEVPEDAATKPVGTPAEAR
jgi:predicted RNase H-like HicB family nuclease